MYSIGYDIGSSSIKAALIELSSGNELAVSSYPETEMAINTPKEGWAEQNPEVWWKSVCWVTNKILKKTDIDPASIKSIGIAYQMHGLVLIDKNLNVLRPAIIWCDSRAVDIGEKALLELGQDYCFHHLLNSPGNFTASKLKWIKENEPEVFERIFKILLPGDYIAMKLTSDVSTTIPGLSEGIFWDFSIHGISTKLLEYYDIPKSMIPEIVDTFSVQGKVGNSAAVETGLTPGTPLTYRAGDQPNNAMSLNVLKPGEIAATGGTSGVVYGLSDQLMSDPESRINAFAHVNHSPSKIRIGQLLCINGAGSQYAWIKKQMSDGNQSYTKMENQIQNIPVGSDGLLIHPFGNGAERMLHNLQTGAQFSNVQFNIHTRAHFYRAALEGIAFSFVFGIKAMEELGIKSETIRVGNDNLFQSATFSETICNLLGCTIEMLNTTGAIGAAKASGIGIKEFSTPEEAINNTEAIKIYRPQASNEMCRSTYEKWEVMLRNIINYSSSTNS